MITVNGKVVTELGTKVKLSDKVIYGDQLLSHERKRYLLLNKQKGYVTTTKDPHAKNTVMELIAGACRERIYPVGRLDKQSEGLILLTNDGPLTNRLTHPRFGHSKVYEVIIEGRVSEDALIKWRRGILLDGTLTAPAEIKILEVNQDETRLEIALREGRKRQIRRVAALLGYEVTGLIRRKIGPISLGNLEPGQWIRLSEGEVKALHESAFGTSKKQILR